MINSLIRQSLRTKLRAVAWTWLAMNALQSVGDAEGWPEFRGPTGQGLSTSEKLPLTWSSSQHVKWRTKIAGKGWSSPIVYQGRVYLTTAVEDSLEKPEAVSLRALCLDAATGEKQWDFEIFSHPAGELSAIHAKNSYASPTPIAEGDRLFVHFGPHGTAALDHRGNVIWRNTTIRYDARHGAGGSPILSGQRLIFNCDGVERPFVIALDRNTGHQRWRTYRPEIEPERFAFSTPLEIEADGQRQIVSPGSSVVCSYAPETGEQIWHVRYPNKWSIIPRPVFANGLVFICTGYEGPAEILAIRPDGRGDVTKTHVAWRSKNNVPHTPSPLVVNGLLFLVSDNGVASCRDAKTGELHWRERIGGNYSASPIHAGGRIYFANESGDCVVVAAAAEFTELARNSLDEPTLASYAATNGALFIRTAEHLYRIEEKPSRSGK